MENGMVINENKSSLHTKKQSEIKRLGDDPLKKWEVGSENSPDIGREHNFADDILNDERKMKERKSFNNTAKNMASFEKIQHMINKK
jgi:hypothetical protein